MGIVAIHPDSFSMAFLEFNKVKSVLQTAVEIADEASANLIDSNLIVTLRTAGWTWYDLEDLEEAARDEVMRAIGYLERRGLLQCTPGNETIIRIHTEVIGA